MKYALTIRKCTPVVKKKIRKLCQRYLKYITYFKERNPTTYVDYYFEAKLKKNGKYNVHVHALVDSETSLTIPKENGWNVHCQPVRVPEAYDKYYKKDRCQTVDDLIDLIECEPLHPMDEDQLIKHLRINKIRLV